MIPPYQPDHDTKQLRRLGNKHGQGIDEVWEDSALRPYATLESALIMAKWLPSEARPRFIKTARIMIAQAQWNRTRSIYCFDPTLKEALAQTSLTHLTDSIFDFLPEWSVYIRAEEQIGDVWLHGGYVCRVPFPDGRFGIIFHMVRAVPNAPANINNAFLFDTMQIPVDPQHPKPFESLIQDMRDRRRKQVQVGDSNIPAWQERILLYAAYLCSTEPDLSAPGNARLAPKRKQRSGPVLTWNVGFRFGAAFRRQLEEATRAPATPGDEEAQEHQRPHVDVRQGHWHTGLSEPGQEERKREIRWFPPVIVNAAGDELPSTLWRQSDAHNRLQKRQ